MNIDSVLKNMKSNDPDYVLTPMPQKLGGGVVLMTRVFLDSER